MRLVKKILRHLKGTKEVGLFLPKEGDEKVLVTWSDAGYVGMNVRAQTGVFVNWIGAAGRVHVEHGRSWAHSWGFGLANHGGPARATGRLGHSFFSGGPLAGQ